MKDRDLELIRSWAAGDVRAGDALVRRHHADIHQYFTGRLPSHAEDLTSVVFLHMTDQKARFEGRSTVRSWLFGIARNVLMAFVRTRREQITFRAVDVDDIVLRDERDLDARVQLSTLDVPRLRACIRRLTPTAQETIDLRFWSGLSEPEMLTTLGLRTLEAVKGRVRTAMVALRREWGASGVRPVKPMPVPPARADRPRLPTFVVHRPRPDASRDEPRMVPTGRTADILRIMAARPELKQREVAAMAGLSASRASALVGLWREAGGDVPAMAPTKRGRPPGGRRPTTARHEAREEMLA